MRLHRLNEKSSFASVYNATKNCCVVLHNGTPVSLSQLASVTNVSQKKVAEMLRVEDEFVQNPAMILQLSCEKKDRFLRETLLICLVGYAGASEKSQRTA